jgi:hypothetical protein
MRGKLVKSVSSVVGLFVFGFPTWRGPAVA